MFKANLIPVDVKDDYILNQRKVFYASLISSFFIGLLVNFTQQSLPITLGAITLYILTFIFFTRAVKKAKMLAAYKIHINNEGIIIYNKEKEHLTIDEECTIEVDNLKMPDENRTIWQKMTQPHQDIPTIAVTKSDDTTKFYFTMPSYFMLNQLTKVLRDWEAKGYKVIDTTTNETMKLAILK